VPKTITLSDATVAELRAVLGDAPPTPVPGPAPSPQPVPNQTPSGVRIVAVPWKTTIGLPNVTIMAGETIAFALLVPPGATSWGRLSNFSISPTDANAYFDRQICLSDVPGDFSQKLAPSALKTGQEPNVYFSVGGYPLDKYKRLDKSNANLDAGGTYYVNVRQVDPTLSCRINYGLALAM